MKLLKRNKQNMNISAKKGFYASNRHIALFCFVLFVVFVLNTAPTFASYANNYTGSLRAGIAAPIVEFSFDEIIRTNANDKTFQYTIDKYSRGLNFYDIQPSDKFECYIKLANYKGNDINEVALQITVSCTIYFTVKTDDGTISTYYYKAGSDDLLEKTKNGFSKVTNEVGSSFNFQYAVGTGHNSLNLKETLSDADIESGNCMAITQSAEDGIVHKTAFLFKPDGNKKDMDYLLQLHLPKQSTSAEDYKNRILHLEFVVDVEQIQI